jgi:hypothetical protein
MQCINTTLLNHLHVLIYALEEALMNLATGKSDKILENGMITLCSDCPLSY